MIHRVAFPAVHLQFAPLTVHRSDVAKAVCSVRPTSAESGGSLTVLPVFRLNANPAFSVGKRRLQHSIRRVAVIHRAVAVPSFWSALSKPAAPRTTMRNAFPKGNGHNRGRSRPLGLRSQPLYQLQHTDDLVMDRDFSIVILCTAVVSSARSACGPERRPGRRSRHRKP